MRDLFTIISDKGDEVENPLNLADVFCTWLLTVREHPLSTYAKFSGFWTPSPPLVRFSRNLSVLSYSKIGHFFDTPSPSARTYFMDAP